MDITLKEGEAVELSEDLSVAAMETPGHTRDSLSYFIPRKKILLCSEAAGIPDAAGYVVSEALVDYDQYYESLNRLSEVDCDVLCLGHRQALTCSDIGKYFQQSLADCRNFLNLVESTLTEFDGDMKLLILVKKSNNIAERFLKKSHVVANVLCRGIDLVGDS